MQPLLDGDAIGVASTELALLRRNALLCYSTATLVMLSTALLTPSLWLYLESMGGDPVLLGAVISAYAAGVAVGSLGFGALYGKLILTRRRGHGRFLTPQPTRRALQFCLVLMFVGNVAYPLAGAAPNITVGGAVMLGARFVEGLGAAVEVVILAYFALVSHGVERTQHFTFVKLAGTVATVIGPALSVAMAQLDTRSDGQYSFDKHTGPGWLALFVTTANLVAVHFWFAEPLATKTAIQGDGDAPAPALAAAPDWCLSLRNLLPDVSRTEMVHLFGLLILFFSLFNCLSVYETIGAPVTQAFYNWDVLENSILWTDVGCSSAMAFIVLYLATRIFPRNVDQVGAVVGTTGLIFAFAVMLAREKVALWRFLLGTVLVAFFFPIAQTTTLAVYSKLLPASNQGAGMGLFNVFGAASRFTGPLWSSATFEVEGGPFWVFLATCCMLAFGLVWILVSYRDVSRRLRSKG